MNPFELYVAYISWGSGGKTRPVLVFAVDDTSAYVYRITSQYENKSAAVRSMYFRISDWKKAGLDKQSYIDTSEVFAFLPSDFNNKNPIGTLSDADKLGLISFLNK